MKQIAFYKAFAYNPSTCSYDLWKGNAPLETIEKCGLRADLAHPLYGDEKLSVDGWAFKAP
jgi:hypothetical protein